MVGSRCDIVTEAVAWQIQGVDGIDYILRVEAGVLVVGVFGVDPDLDRFGDAVGKVGATAVLEGKKASPRYFVGLGVIVLNEAAGPPHHEKAHEFAPVVGFLAFFKGGQRAHRALMAADELGLAQRADKFLRANAEVLVFGDEEAELVGKVVVSFIVGGGGKEDAAALVFKDVFLDCAVALARAVAEVVAFVDQDDLVAAKVREFIDSLRDGENFGQQPVFGDVVLPHLDEIFRAQNQGLRVVIILEDFGQGSSHQRFAEADNIANQHTAALVEVVCGDFYGSNLVVE
jgi:hypothetical protein